MDQNIAASLWSRHARQSQLKLNAGWWVQAFMPLAVLGALVATVSILLFRIKGGQIAGWHWGAIGIGAGLLALAAALYARRRFATTDDAFVRIEAAMGLRNRLTAARAGVAQWPEPPAEVRDGVRWRWHWLYGPPLACAALVVAAIFLPVPDNQAASIKPQQPSSWGEMEKNLEELAKAETIDSQTIEKFERQLEELKMQPVKDWYSHGSMEASDHLRKALSDSARDLGEGMQNAERSLNALQNYDDQLSERARAMMLNEFEAALEGLKNGDLKPNPDLMKALDNLDPGALKQLSKEQLDKLRENLKKTAEACKNCQGNGQGQGEGEGEGNGEDQDELERLIQGMNEGSGNCNGNGQGEGPGKGGISRGPGTAPLTLADDETDLKTKKFEGVSNDDFSQALPSDVLATSTGKHDTDQSDEIGVRAGGDAATGQGGDTVWKDQFLPEEKQVLKKFFK